MCRIEQSGRMSLRRPRPPIKGGSVPEKEEDAIFQLTIGGLADRIIPLHTERFNNVTFKLKQKFKI